MFLITVSYFQYFHLIFKRFPFAVFFPIDTFSLFQHRFIVVVFRKFWCCQHTYDLKWFVIRRGHHARSRCTRPPPASCTASRCSRSRGVSGLLDVPPNPLEGDARSRRPEDLEDGQHHARGADGYLVGAPVIREWVQHGGREHLQDLDSVWRLPCVWQLGVWQAVVEREVELVEVPEDVESTSVPPTRDQECEIQNSWEREAQQWPSLPEACYLWFLAYFIDTFIVAIIANFQFETLF